MNERLSKNASSPQVRRPARVVPSKASLTERTIDFGPLTGHFGYYLRRLQHVFSRYFNNSALGSRLQARDVGAMFVIGLNPGVTPSQLTSALMMDAAPVTTMLNAFETRGWIIRRVSGTDARSRTVYLTPEGQEVLDDLRRLAGVVDQDFVDGILTPDESRQLVLLLSKLLAGHRK